MVIANDEWPSHFCRTLTGTPLQDAVAPVGVPEGVGMDPGWLNAGRGRGLLHTLPHRLAGTARRAAGLRALVSPEARSLRTSTKSSGIGISRAVLALFPTMSAGRLMIGGKPVKAELRRPHLQGLGDAKATPKHQAHRQAGGLRIQFAWTSLAASSIVK